MYRFRRLGCCAGGVGNVDIARVSYAPPAPLDVIEPRTASTA
jgi:hypothetical protein